MLAPCALNSLVLIRPTLQPFFMYPEYGDQPIIGRNASSTLMISSSTPYHLDRNLRDIGAVLHTLLQEGISNKFEKYGWCNLSSKDLCHSSSPGNLDIYDAKVQTLKKPKQPQTNSKLCAIFG